MCSLTQAGEQFKTRFQIDAVACAYGACNGERAAIDKMQQQTKKYPVGIEYR
jgi:hypothetical protein